MNNTQQNLKTKWTRAFSCAPRAAALSLAMLGGVAVCTLLAPATAYAQNTNATIRGTVTDPTGALVPGAHVMVVNKNTGVVAFNATTDAAGLFVAPQVPPGTYKVTVTAQGLKTSVTDNLNATVAQVAALDIKLELGDVSETVTVQSKGEELDRSTSDISTLISPAEVQNVPLVGRQVENLLALVPGVAHGGAADTPSTSQLSINGSRTLNIEVLLNGVSTIVASTGSPLSLPSPDGVDQFRVLATNAPAEYGRTAGAVLSVNTLSGTNKYHGNFYFLLRNEDMDANTYFNKLKINTTTGLPTPRAKDRYFQLGGSFGGALRIPKLYNGRDKTFFFVNYDFTIAPSTTTFTDTVPTVDQRAGNLSLALNTTGQDGKSRTAVTVYQPNGTTSAAFPGNQVGPIDTGAAAILKYVPLPNIQGTYDPINNRYTGNWTTQQNNTNHTARWVARVDEQITTKDRLSLNLYRYTTHTPNAVNYNQDQAGQSYTFNTALLNTTWDCTCNNAWLPSVDYTRTWSSTLVTDLNMGFFRNVVLRNPPGTGLSAATKLGIASLPLDQTPELTSPGFSNLGADTNTNQINITNTFTPFGTVTKTIAAHTLKFGGSLRKNQFNSYNPSASPEGALNFDGSITNRGTTGNATTGLADFLLGKIKTGSYEQPMPPTGRRNWNLGFFFQDDWRATSKLTINAGIRWEYESPLTIAHNIYSRFDPATGTMLVAGRNSSSSLGINTPKNDISPRVGFAYSVDNNTVIRAAFGTFFGTIFQNLGGQIAFPGYDNNISYNNLGTGIAQPFSLSQGFQLSPAANGGDPRLAPLYVNATDAVPYSVSGVEFNQMDKMPVVEQWSLGFQRKLPLAITMEVNYVGNHAVHLPYNVPANYVPLASSDAVTLANTTKATQDARPFTTLTGWTVVDHVGNSDYNALQVSVRRQFNRSLAVMSNYTFAKSMDDGSTIYNFSAPNGTANAQYTVDGPSRAKDFAPSNIDVKHTLNIGLVYTTGGPWWLRNWHISPVFYGHTGLPVNITQSNEIAGISQQRPNGNPQSIRLAHPYINGQVLQYYAPVLPTATSQPSDYPLTASGPVYATVGAAGVRTRVVNSGFGNVSRDSNRAPGEVDFDASVAKDFKLYRALNFQIRVDAFNVINKTNFTSPASALGVNPVVDSTPAKNYVGTYLNNTASFGQISGTQSARRMQASARFFF